MRNKISLIPLNKGGKEENSVIESARHFRWFQKLLPHRLFRRRRLFDKSRLTD
jgi:hypothetical protein